MTIASATALAGQGLMGVARDRTPAVMIDPATNKLFISALLPVTVGVMGEAK